MKFFNFCHKARNLLSHISEDSAESPDSKDTKYINYRPKIREKTCSTVSLSKRCLRKKTSCLGASGAAQPKSLAT